MLCRWQTNITLILCILLALPAILARLMLRVRYPAEPASPVKAFNRDNTIFPQASDKLENDITLPTKTPAIPKSESSYYLYPDISSRESKSKHGKQVNVEAMVNIQVGNLTIHCVCSQDDLTPNPNLMILDATGTGSGWHINIRIVDKIVMGNKAKVLNWIWLPTDRIVVNYGNTPPASQVLSPVPLSEWDRTMSVAGRGEGMGSFTLIPRVLPGVDVDDWVKTHSLLLVACLIASP